MGKWNSYSISVRNVWSCMISVRSPIGIFVILRDSPFWTTAFLYDDCIHFIYALNIGIPCQDRYPYPEND